jgi:acid phosphatase (class A)
MPAMKARRLASFALAGALCLALVAPLRAAGPYLHGVDPLILLAPPTVLHTPEDVADRDSAFQVYRARIPEDVARAKAEHKVTPYAYAAAIGPFLKPGKFPKLDAMFKDLDLEAKKVSDAGKNHWKRLRPYVQDPTRFSEPGDPEDSFAYPSGHSTRGTAFALILAEIFPEQRDAILEKGRLIGWTRVEVGVHTPQDIYAGRVLGQAIAQALLRDPAFQQDLAAVKAEVAAGR